MANPNVTAFIDVTTAVAARAAEVSAASFIDGGNWCASNAPGIGINIGGGALTEDDNQWTLLDQTGAARTPQDSSYLGNTGLGEGATGAGTVFISTSANATDGLGDNSATVTGTADLITLAAGWVV